MKKATFLVLIALIYGLLNPIGAISQDMMYITKKDKSVVIIPISEIEKITYNNAAGNSVGNTVTDIDGNEYKVVTIGNQVWMAENLRTTKYNNGTSISVVTDKDTWQNLTSAGMCWYDFEQGKYSSVYGALYNGYVIETDKVCPTGWHVPTDKDWDELQQPYGAYAGIQLKEQGNHHWKDNSPKVTNETGFTALGSGYINSVGYFNSINGTGVWWTKTAASQTDLATRAMWGNNNSLGKGRYPKKSGNSIRCIKD